MLARHQHLGPTSLSVTGFFYVYIYQDPETHIPFYVGKGKGKRKGYTSNHQHGWCGQKLKSLSAKGLRPEIVIYAENVPEQQAFCLERELIKRYGRRDIGTGILCNMTDGGEGFSGRKATEEQNRRNSERNKGKKQSAETVKKRTAGQWGRKMSTEAIRKRTEKQKGRKRSKATCRKIGDSKRGTKLSAESIRKRTESRGGFKHSPATITKMSEARKRWHQNKKEVQNGSEKR
jgi:hypothetical protein